MRLDAGQQFDALVGERFGGEAPWVTLAAVAGRRNDGANPVVESRGEQCLLAVAGVAGQPDLRGIYFRQRHQIIDRAGGGPGPAGQHREVVLRIDLDPRIRVVAISIAWIGGVIDASDVAAAHRRVNPRAIARVIGEEHRPPSSAIRDHQFQAQRGAMVRPELQPHLADRDAPVATAPGYHGAQILGLGRKRTEHPVLDLTAQLRPLPLPLGSRAHRAALGHKRVRQAGD